MKTLHHVVRAALIVLGLVISAPSHAENDYARCVLDNLNWVQNDGSARMIIQLCVKRYPSGAERAAKDPRWMAKYTSGAECGDRIAKASGGSIAPRLIVAICYALYEPLPAAPEPAAAPSIAAAAPTAGPASPAPLYFRTDSIKTVAADMAALAPGRKAQDSAAPAARQGGANPPAEDKNAAPAVERKGVVISPSQNSQARRCVVKSVMTDAELALCRA